MRLLIDGYNLLHVTGITGRRGDLQGSREALLRFLASTIEPKDRPYATIVFDAAEAPPGLPRTVTVEEMTIRYASEYESADALLEELIAENNVPRSLLVVSSDHRVQRAARRRRAQFIDSDIWFAEAVRQRDRLRSFPSPPHAAKPSGPLAADEISYWVAEFADAPTLETSTPSEEIGTQPKPRPAEEEEADEPTPDDLKNPFPPGYGEDLLEEPDRRPE